MRINKELRLAVHWRQLQFGFLNFYKIFWLIKRIPGLKIKEPFNKLYERHLKQKL